MATGDTLAMFDARQAFFPSSNYATPSTRNIHPTLLFDDTTQETVYFQGVMPQNYGGGDITVYVHYSAVSATSGTGGWLAAFERIGDGSQDVDSNGFASDQTITATTVPATSGNVDILSVTVTAGSATDSIAAGELYRICIKRNVASDTATGDLELHAVELREA